MLFRRNTLPSSPEPISSDRSMGHNSLPSEENSLSSLLNSSPDIAATILDTLQSDGVAIATPDTGAGTEGNRIFYMNQKMSEMIEKMSPEIRREYGLGPDQVSGGSIHRFHKNPDRIRKILSLFRFPS